MSLIRKWLANPWPVWRLQPTQQDAQIEENLYLQIPEALIERWIETNLMSNPQSTDPNICVAWAARCDFIESIIRIRDRAGNRAKYEVRKAA